MLSINFYSRLLGKTNVLSFLSLYWLISSILSLWFSIYIGHFYTKNDYLSRTPWKAQHVQMGLLIFYWFFLFTFLTPPPPNFYSNNENLYQIIISTIDNIIYYAIGFSLRGFSNKIWGSTRIIQDETKNRRFWKFFLEKHNPNPKFL